MSYFSGSATDMLCGQCGRPVIGQMVFGANGPYHPECVRGPQPEIRQTHGWDGLNIALTDICRRLIELEKRLAELERKA